MRRKVQVLSSFHVCLFMFSYVVCCPASVSIAQDTLQQRGTSSGDCKQAVLTQLDKRQQLPVRLSPTGDAILFRGTGDYGNDNALLVKKLGSTTTLAELHYPFPILQSAWSLNGRYVAFLVSPPLSLGRRLIVWDIFRRTTKESDLELSRGEGALTWSPDSKFLLFSEASRGLLVVKADDGSLEGQILGDYSSYGWADLSESVIAVSASNHSELLRFEKTGGAAASRSIDSKYEIEKLGVGSNGVAAFALGVRTTFPTRYLINLSSGQSVVLRSLKRSIQVGDFVVTAGNKFGVIERHDSVEKRQYILERINIQTGKEQVVGPARGFVNIRSISSTRQDLAITYENTSPVALISLNLATNRMTTIARGSASSSAAPRLDIVRIGTADGVKVPIFVWRPAKRLPIGIFIDVPGGAHPQLLPVWQKHIAFLVDRGFIYIQINLRGSYGFGLSYFDAATGKGQRVEDITGVIRFAQVSTGLAPTKTILSCWSAATIPCLQVADRPNIHVGLIQLLSPTRRLASQPLSFDRRGDPVGVQVYEPSADLKSAPDSYSQDRLHDLLRPLFASDTRFEYKVVSDEHVWHSDVSFAEAYAGAIRFLGHTCAE